MNKLERLHVVIAKAGIASRRAAERMIQDGRVRVNGRSAEIGMKIDPAHDKIQIDGKPLLFQKPRSRYFIFNKPIGVTTTLKDVHALKTVADYFKDLPERLVPAGRLDKDSSGLILMTNDGELLHRLTHPRFGVEKHYQVTVNRRVTDEELQKLGNGSIVLDGKKTSSCKIKRTGQKVLLIVLHEGRKRQIRRMIVSVGAEVTRLHRVSYGPLHLGSLRSGERRELTENEIELLKRKKM